MGKGGAGTTAAGEEVAATEDETSAAAVAAAAAAAATTAAALEELRAEAQGMEKEIAEQERLLSAYQKENERLLEKSKKASHASHACSAQ